LAPIWCILQQKNISIMVVSMKDKGNNAGEQEKEWDNPRAPELTGDQRDAEQLERQKKEAERRKENLTETDDDKKNTNN
jgi:hypothetical protein